MKPWLWLPPNWSHSLAPLVLPLLSAMSSKGPEKWKPLFWKGLEFPNPLGLAGGVDKEGSQLLSWQRLGAGFLEVGTITPQPQGPNRGKIMDRDFQSLAIWNKMGFPNPGAETVKETLLRINSALQVPLFINIGKNRETSNDIAIQDYVAAYKTLQACSDTFVINISSPNTKGLRDLQSKSYLNAFLKQMRDITADKKLLVKLSPDLTRDSLRESLDLLLEHSIDGVILTNTTLQRPGTLPFQPEEGGVSGAPLKDLSRRALLESVEHIKDDKSRLLMVSVGGILSADEIQWRLDHGANLVQVYSALIYEGPYFFRNAAGYQWH